ncbi:hypothetical protein [Streptomyces zhihengii]|uniref:Uncharacterized protein n=1 Tax=Streptomyces zhihengii TaxID=1818004 RepID=A0ABS2UV77_9ACTN|nr:hypothetical protein [Streptomyces zhihengii]MBM9621414.1 hypothetical protein [Streptomyces zhihengii]
MAGWFLGLFVPKGAFGPPDAAVRTAGALRGVLLLLIVLFPFELALPDFTTAWRHGLTSFYALAVALPLACLLLVAAAPPGERGWTARCAGRPLGSLGVAAAVVLAAVLATEDPASPFVGVITGLFFIVVLGLVLLVGYYHHFRAADGHPLLPALVAPWPVWAVALEDPSGPGALAVYGPAVITTCVSVWEITHLHRRGLPLTAGAPRA